MAVQHINEAGGVLGRKLRLEIADDACEPKQAVPHGRVAGAEKGRVRRWTLLLGRVDSGLGGLCREQRPCEWRPPSTNPRLTDEAKAKNWKTVARTCGRDDAQASSPASPWPPSTRARTSPSCTTRARTGRASPTRPESQRVRPDRGAVRLLPEGQRLHRAHQQNEGDGHRRGLCRLASQRSRLDGQAGPRAGIQGPVRERGRDCHRRTGKLRAGGKGC